MSEVVHLYCQSCKKEIDLPDKPIYIEDKNLESTGTLIEGIQGSFMKYLYELQRKNLYQTHDYHYKNDSKYRELFTETLLKNPKSSFNNLHNTDAVINSFNCKLESIRNSNHYYVCKDCYDHITDDHKLTFSVNEVYNFFNKKNNDSSQ